MITALANPHRFLAFARWAMPAATVAAVLLFAIGLPWGLFYAPAERLQGESVRIIYIHVPAAWWALGVYVFMAGACFVGFVWRHAIADVAAKAAAPIGAVYAGLCLATGSLWAEATWERWWVWDARLTSMLILFLTYLGYLALHAAIEDEERAARIAGVFCMAGLINVPIVHFSVDWWTTQHQGASVFRADGPSIDPSMLWPLLVMALAYAAAFAALLMANMQAEIHRRRVEAAAARRLRAA
ncbi:MAG: heme transporter HemC [Alphaproteobacteria bacterium]|nr:heme transporter HemC [Alphaproteobacteria bacterium]